MPFNVQVPQLSRALWLRIGNTFAFIVTLVVNVLANTITINGHNTGEVSGEHPTFVTPAGFTFSIWVLIYLCLTAFIIYSWTNGEEVVGADGVLEKIGYWFMVSCVANFTWLLMFVGGCGCVPRIILIQNSTMNRWLLNCPSSFWHLPAWE
jgi:tryptophan-rich sensory protein